MKKHILNIVILIILLVGISFCYCALSPDRDVLYEAVPVDKDERLIYMQELLDVIQDGIMCRQKMIDIRAFRCDDNTLQEVMSLTPFSDPSCSLYTQNYNIILSISGHVKYIFLDYSTESQAEYIINEITAIADTMDEGLSDLEKVIWINNYICNNYEYDDDHLNDDVFKMWGTSEGMCGAYTQMFTILANEVGLQSSFAASFKMQHVWNIVQVDGQWYNIDVTWNDDDRYICCYLYSDDTMLLVHSPKRSAEDTIQFVTCDDTRYDGVQLNVKDSGG